MLYNCTDFIYNKKSLSDFEYVVVSFETSDELPLGLERTIEKSQKNRFRVDSNIYSITYTNDLEFKISIMKDMCTYVDTSEQKITEDDLRKITKWLTSVTSPMWLERKNGDVVDDIRYCGLFTNIEPFFLGELYGLTLTFSCTSSFGYTHDKIIEKELTGITNFMINNESDLLENYCYPTVELFPNANTDFFLINLSDTELKDQGMLSNLSMTELQNKIKQFGTNNGLKIRFETTAEGEIITYCNNRVISFYATDMNNKENKLVAYYADGGTYHIYQGSYICFKLYSKLNVKIKCKESKIYDSLNRPILFSKLGIRDVDYLYWLRLKTGYNSIMCISDQCKIKITHNEARKVGAY